MGGTQFLKEVIFIRIFLNNTLEWHLFYDYDYRYQRKRCRSKTVWCLKVFYVLIPTPSENPNHTHSQGVQSKLPQNELATGSRHTSVPSLKLSRRIWIRGLTNKRLSLIFSFALSIRQNTLYLLNVYSCHLAMTLWSP